MKKLHLRASPLVFLVLFSGTQVKAQAETEKVPEQGTEPATPAAATPAAVRAPETRTRDLLNRPGGLTSDEAARQAASYSLQAEVAQEEYKSADAQKKEVVYNYAPKVTLTASYTRQMVPEVQDTFGGANLVGTTAAPGALDPAADPLFAIDGSAFSFNQLPNQYYLNAGVVVPVSDYVFNLSQAMSGANAAKHAAELRERAARVEAGANARLYYYDWVRVRLRREEAAKAISRAELQLENLKRLQAGGRVSRSDVLRQEAFLSRVQFEMNRANVQEVVARQQLHQVMTGGRGDVPTWEVGEPIIDGRGEIPDISDLDRLESEAVDKRLEIEALENTAYALEQRSSVERSQGLPRVEAFGNLTYANPNQIYFPPQQEWNESWNVGIRMNWTLNDLGSRRAAASATDAETAKIRVQKKQLEDALRTEVLTTSQTLVQANLAIDSAEHGVAAAEAAHDDRSQLVQYGRGTILDLVDSETALITARLDLIDAYIALKSARVRFDHALGRDIESTLAASKTSGK